MEMKLQIYLLFYWFLTFVNLLVLDRKEGI